MLTVILMDPEGQLIVDWVNLPTGTSTISLWEALHDGDLLAIESDLLARTVSLRFDVGYIRRFHQLPEGTQFIVSVEGAQSVRAVRYVPWPGGCPIPEGTPNEEQSILIAEYQRKWREESQSWNDFERLSRNPVGLRVSNASLCLGTHVVALQLGLHVARDSYAEAYIRGEAITFSIGESKVTLEEFIAFGGAYWDAFANKARARRPS
jgi:hypothetical protein